MATKINFKYSLRNCSRSSAHVRQFGVLLYHKEHIFSSALAVYVATRKCKNIGKRNDPSMDFLEGCHFWALWGTSQNYAILQKNCFPTLNLRLCCTLKIALLLYCDTAKIWLGHVKSHAIRNLNVEEIFTGFREKAHATVTQQQVSRQWIPYKFIVHTINWTIPTRW